ncbi:MAG: DNA cytosine methyltransferase [Gemmatimonadales bacterium]|nr:DNA cytosine methyltransferase [Gemmatimonadales bacterium]
MSDRAYKVLHFFCGAGGGGLGFRRAEAEFRGVRARFEGIGAIDCDPLACEDYRRLVGEPATVLDLFTRSDYVDHHSTWVQHDGRWVMTQRVEPPAGWREASAEDVLRITGGQRPDVVFGSPPCRGFSGLLGSKAATSPKYAALNRLVPRWVRLVMEAWPHDPPGLFLLENVPRIVQRGEPLLAEIRDLLGRYGYDLAESSHNCGELGALSQHRQRFLLVARHRARVDALLYQPLRRRVRPIRDVIMRMPMPEDPAGGPMHELPRIRAKTWIRLALIRAGKDWRDLAARWAPDRWGLVPEARCGRFNNVFRLVRQDEPAPAITAGVGPSAGGLAVADPRCPNGWGGKGKYRVSGPGEPVGTVIGASSTGQGAFAVADPRLPEAFGEHGTKLQIDGVDRPARVVTGARVGSGGLVVADPRMGVRDGYANLCRVADPDEPASTVTGASRPAGGALSFADPRPTERWHPGVLGVQDGDEASGTVTGRASPTTGAFSFADPRLATDMGPKSVTLRVRSADVAAALVGQRDLGEIDLADRSLMVIVSDDGCWHRPLTTLELLALQGFPTHTEHVVADDGRIVHEPVVLAGRSSTRWREAVGNAVPPPSAQAIAEQMLTTLLVHDCGAFVLSSDGGVWVGGRRIATVDLADAQGVVRFLDGLDVEDVGAVEADGLVERDGRQRPWRATP